MKEGESQGNPYNSPHQITEGGSDAAPQPAQPTIYDHASKYSLYAPFIVILINYLIPTPHASENALDKESHRQVAYLLTWLCAITTVSAFLLGIVGFIGGISRKKLWTVVRASLGVLVNGVMILLVGSVVVQYLLRAKP